MNERIRELRRQATLVETYTTNNGTVAESKHVDLEKFAHLIVAECAGLFPNVLVSISTEYGHTPVVAADYIKKHFGIEGQNG